MTKEIILTQGKVALVDDEDYEELMGWKWFASKNGRTFYANRRDGTHKHLFMHRHILKPKDEERIDHIDGNGLNNQKRNFRIASHSENQHNSRLRIDNITGYKGITSYRNGRRWRSVIQVNNKSKYLGSYATAEEAARAYDTAAREYFGEFTRTNFQ